MEPFFLACFLFGALFTLASLALGHASSPLAGMLGSHAGHELPAGDGIHASPGDAIHPGSLPDGNAVGHHGSLPLFNVSSALAFLTWFGATGYVLLRFAAWSALFALPLAVAAGGEGGLLVAAFLRKVRQGERVMDPRDYRMEGTIARVTVTIPAGGVGEIVFTKGGIRDSEAARSRSGRMLPRETEVVVIDYAHGVASVQPWAEFVAQEGRGAPGPGTPPVD